VSHPDPAAKEIIFDIAGAGVDKGLCTNVTVRQVPPSDVIAIKSILDSGANEDCSSGIAGDGNFTASVGAARTYNTKGLKKRKCRLGRNQDRRPGADMKRTSFDHSDYRAAQHTLAGNVGIVSGIFFPQTGQHNDMSASCRRHDTDHVGDIARFCLARHRVRVVSAC
jgi:hypothetical protein